MGICRVYHNPVKYQGYRTSNILIALLTTDFQKAFDSIQWKFITQVLTKYNFGPVLMNWIDVMYADINSCIYNNGKSSKYSTLQGGVRQGDPLSPHLFIITVVACMIIDNRNIKGFHIGSKEIKLTQYQREMSHYLRGLKSICTGSQIDWGTAWQLIVLFKYDLDRSTTWLQWWPLEH